MSSIAHQIMDETVEEHANMGLREFTRLERMLLFAVVSECERCVKSEGYDCFDFGKHVDCPFVSVREEYEVRDIVEWRERVR